MTDPISAAPRWLVSIAVMLTTIMVILDMTIVNVALPHMMGALGATSEQISWVLTSYIAANAMFIPLTGFLSQRFGRKRLMLFSIAAFALTSALCGQARNLPEMVLFRGLQGIAGAAVIPLSQAVMVDTYSAEERGRGMAYWGIGIMLGPVLGPTVGGYLTDHLGWRWVFYINIPFAILALTMVSTLLGETKGARARADWFGALLMMLGIASLQILLDRGNQEDWFNSSLIVTLGAASVLALTWFAVRGWRRSDTVVRLRLLRDRNLATASACMAAFGLGLFGTIVLQPLLLERLLGYPAATAGLVMAPRGVGTALSMWLVSRLIVHRDPRQLMLAGMLFTAASSYVMTWYNLEISPLWAAWPGFVQGLGMGMIFVPLTTLAYDTIEPSEIDHATGIFNLLRTVGSSAGISLLTTVLARAQQLHWNQLGGHLNPFNPALQAWVSERGTTLSDPRLAPLLGLELARHSTMLAFIDALRLVSLSFVLLAPLVFVLRRPQRHAARLAQQTSA